MNSLPPSEVKEFLKKHFADKFRAKGIDPESVDDDFNLLAAGVIDSFGVIEMMTIIEQEFKMEIDIENLNPDDISMIGRFCKFVSESHGKAQR